MEEKAQFIHLSEYGDKMPAIIRNMAKAPKCPQAIIPSLVVENTRGLKGLAGCFVHVLENNTTYYVDDKHRIITIYAGQVEINDYDYKANPNNLRSQTLVDFKNNRVVIYNKSGDYRIIETKEED